MTEIAAPSSAASDPWRAIPPDEFRERQRRAREAAAAAGCDGAVVWSRGGAFMDMCADVLYLSNHYSQQPYMGDEAGIGSARSHGVVVLPVEGPTTVVVDVPWWRRDLVVADDVRPTIHVVEAAAEAIRAAGLGTGAHRARRRELHDGCRMARFDGTAARRGAGACRHAHRGVAPRQEPERAGADPPRLRARQPNAGSTRRRRRRGRDRGGRHGRGGADAHLRRRRPLRRSLLVGPVVASVHPCPASFRGRRQALPARRPLPRRLLRLVRRLLLRLRPLALRRRRPDPGPAGAAGGGDRRRRDDLRRDPARHQRR